MSDWNKVTLDCLGGGVALELFQDSLKDVIDNILDLNTPATGVREIKLSIKFKPDQNREKVNYLIDAQTKLCPVNSYLSTMYVGKEGRDLVAYEQDADQGNLFADELKNIELRSVEND